MNTALNTPPPLFSPGDAEDAAYRNLQGEVSDLARACKQFAEELWARFHPYADNHFLTEIRRDFDARFWEMYLTCTLLDQAPRHDYVLSCPKPGPDVLLTHRERRVWVEAIVATDGDPKLPDSAVEQQTGEIPVDKIVLRYTNAINAKYNKYVEYRRNGTVAENDAYIIAVNSYPLSYRWAEPEIPRILKAVFPIGAYEVLMDRRTQEVVGRRHQFRAKIKKTSGAEVSTEIFSTEQHSGISALLHSGQNAYPHPALGTDFLIVHNPFASQPIPVGLVPAAREYQATPVEDGFELVRSAGTLAEPGQEAG